MKRNYIPPSTYVDILPVTECPLNASKPDGVGGTEENPNPEGGDYYEDARRRGSSFSGNYSQRNGGWSRGGLW